MIRRKRPDWLPLYMQAYPRAPRSPLWWCWYVQQRLLSLVNTHNSHLGLLIGVHLGVVKKRTEQIVKHRRLWQLQMQPE